MTIYYVGKGGNDGNSGLTWALRFLTLNGAEDEPVAAGDTVYVGPGVYRELLLVDVSGTDGNPITYIGDVTGENTDGIGGIVRITGSDNDQSGTRSYCIHDNNTQRNYRTFRGFKFDLTTSHAIYGGVAGINWIIEDCTFCDLPLNGIYVFNSVQEDWIIRRCLFIHTKVYGDWIKFDHSSDVSNTGHLIENCVFDGTYGGRTNFSDVGGATIKNCLFLGGQGAVSVTSALAAGQTITVNNCVIVGMHTAFNAQAVGEIVEDYNALYNNDTDYANTTVGDNTLAYPPLLTTPILFDDYQFPWKFGELSEWSQIRSIKGTGTATDDLFGMIRPLEENDISWGAIQFHDIERETGTVHGGVVSAVFHEPARKQVWVPVENEETVFSVWVYRLNTYSGTYPQMKVMQPSQTDLLVTDTGAINQWNKLAVTGTVVATPPYAVVELISNHMGTGSSDVFFDDLDVS